MSGHQNRKGGTSAPWRKHKESRDSHQPTQAPSQPNGIPPPGPRHAPPRLLSLSTPRPAPQHPQQALPKGPASRPSQRSITAPPPKWKVPGQITARPLGGPPGERPTNRAQRYRPVRRRPGARRNAAPPGHSALLGLPRHRLCRPVRAVGGCPTQNKQTIYGFHRRHHRQVPVYERRSRVLALTPLWGGRALPVDETAPEREFLASRPHPLGSMGLRLHRRHHRQAPVYERRSRVHALTTWGVRALPVDEAAPEREILASRPYPIGSMGLSQDRRRCGPSPGADTPHRYRRRRHPAQTVRDLPLPPLPVRHSHSYYRQSRPYYCHSCGGRNVDSHFKCNTLSKKISAGVL